MLVQIGSYLMFHIILKKQFNHYGYFCTSCTNRTCMINICCLVGIVFGKIQGIVLVWPTKWKILSTCNRFSRKKSLCLWILLFVMQACCLHPGVLPSKRLLGTCRWMGSHFHNWVYYNGVTFLLELLEWGRTFSGFL